MAPGISTSHHSLIFIELLTGQGYNYSVDWWSIGVITFELLTGFTPFGGESPKDVFANIHQYSIVLDEIQQAIHDDLPNLISRVAWDFIRRYK